MQLLSSWGVVEGRKAFVESCGLWGYRGARWVGKGMGKGEGGRGRVNGLVWGVGIGGGIGMGMGMGMGMGNSPIIHLTFL
jgi:hypothetical protein